jgi:hypothetical protein
MNRRSSTLGLCAAIVLVLAAGTAHTAPLNRSFAGEYYLDTALTGTTSSARPELAALTLVDEAQPFLIGAANLSGFVQISVVQEATGALDFYWRVVVDPQSTGSGITGLRLGDFGYDDLVDADYRTDGLGLAGPAIARLFNPAMEPGGSLNFLFADPVRDSYFFFLHTDATSYAKTAVYDLLVGNQVATGLFETYAPARVPEPAATLLMVVGLAGLARRGLRKRSR